MERTAQIRLESRDSELCFNWLGYDGDDCFQDFHLTCRLGTAEQPFDFGPCVVWGLRKLSRFFSDPTHPELVHPLGPTKFMEPHSSAS